MKYFKVQGGALRWELFVPLREAETCRQDLLEAHLEENSDKARC